MDTDSYPLFICLVLAMSLIILMACINNAQREKIMSFKEISPEQAWEMVQNGAMLADIRDPLNVSPILMRRGFSFNQPKLLQFEEQVDFDSPIIVSCYHGVSSRNVGNFPR